MYQLWIVCGGCVMTRKLCQLHFSILVSFCSTEFIAFHHSTSLRSSDKSYLYIFSYNQFIFATVNCQVPLLQHARLVVVLSKARKAFERASSLPERGSILNATAKSAVISFALISGTSIGNESRCINCGRRLQQPTVEKKRPTTANPGTTRGGNRRQQIDKSQENFGCCDDDKCDGN